MATLFIAAITIRSAAAAPADEPAHVFIDCRPTNPTSKNNRNELILREVPRQALIIGIEHDLARPCTVRDATIEPAATAAAGDVQFGVDRVFFLDHGACSLRLRLFDAQNQVLDETRLHLPFGPHETVDYSELTARSVDLINQKWLPIIAAQLGTTVKPPGTDNGKPAIAAAEALLSTIDFHHAYLAGQETHAAIAKSGESAARLATLVGAYTNLGESSRHLFNGQSSAFFARALVYGERLSRLAPDAPESWWIRAYAEAVFSRPLNAIADLDKGDALASTSHAVAPAWVGLVRSLVHYNTIELFDQMKGSANGLASYFACLTVESALTPSLPINFARAAMTQNPNALRLLSIMEENTGVGPLHTLTEDAPRLLNRMTSLLARDADDATVRTAVATATQRQFDQPSILELLKQLEQQPLTAGQLLPWSTYASFIRESEFVNAVRRMYFVADEWGVDPADEKQTWWPLIKDHRYAALIEAVPTLNEKLTPEQSKKVQAIEFKDDVSHVGEVNWLLMSMGIPKDPRLNLDWSVRESNLMDRTAWDFSRRIWNARNGNLRKFQLNMTEELAVVAPDHPLVAAIPAMFDWDHFAPKADQVAKDFGQNPIVAYGVGVGYADHGQFAKAIPLLQTVVKVAPDYTSYAALADAYLKGGDEKRWQATWDTYLANVEDLGLDHSRAGATVASYFDDRGRYEEALPYAKVAAECGSSWGYHSYAFTLEGLGHFKEANDVLVEDMERYGVPNVWYQFAAATGYGDPAAVARTYDTWYQQHGYKTDADSVLDYAIFLLAQGRLDEGDQQLAAADALRHERYTELCIALRDVEKNKPDDAEAELAKAKGLKIRNGRDSRYDLCIDEFQRCLKDPSTLPAHDCAFVDSWKEADASPQKFNGCYIFGRLCELRQKPEEAKAWYRLSLERPAQEFTLRVPAVQRLRALGENPFAGKAGATTGPAQAAPTSQP